MPRVPFSVVNSSISAVEASAIELPNGTNYSTQVGTLSLGAPGKGNQRFSKVPDVGSVNGQTIPGYGNASEGLPSNAFGFHYGSVPLNQTGSLVFGGYDQSRVLGDAATFDLVGGENMKIIGHLLDIGIGVKTGWTPFSNNTIPYLGPYLRETSPISVAFLNTTHRFRTVNRRSSIQLYLLHVSTNVCEYCPESSCKVSTRD